MKNCDHQIIRRNVETGDPVQVHLICVKCGETADYNLITKEIR